MAEPEHFRARFCTIDNAFWGFLLKGEKGSSRLKGLYNGCMYLILSIVF